MKLNIARSDKQVIEGYTNIVINDKIKESLSDVINGSCTEVLCLNALEKIPHSEGLDFLSNLLYKVRNLGKINISGLDFRSLCESFVGDKISIELVNTALSDAPNVYDYNVVIKMLEERQFIVDTFLLKGQTYQIQATRVSND